MHRFQGIVAYWSKINDKPTPLSFDPRQVNPRKYLHKPYVARNYDRWSTFLPLTVWVIFCFGDTVAYTSITVAYTSIVRSSSRVLSDALGIRRR